MNHNIKSSDVFLKSDIRNILQSLILAIQALEPEPTDRSRGAIIGVGMVAKALGIALDCEVRL